MRLGLVLLWFMACPLVAAAAPNARLVDARAKVEDLNYDGALKALEQATLQPGNDRASVLEILELQGVCWATLGKADKARTAFRTLLVLDPEHGLAGAQPPRVKTPFYEAKEWAAKSGALELVPQIEKRGDLVASLTVGAPTDVLNLARELVLHTDVDGVKKEARVKLDKAVRSVTATVGTPAVAWWAQALGDKGAVLVELGTEAAPRVEEPRKPDAPVAQPAPRLAPEVAATPPPSAGKTQRIAGVVVGLAGIGALVAGAALGGLAADARGQLDRAKAEFDATGAVTSLTQRRAAELDAQAQSSGLAANMLLVGGGVLAAGGLALVLFAPDDPLVVAPVPGGATVSGRF